MRKTVAQVEPGLETRIPKPDQHSDHVAELFLGQDVSLVCLFDVKISSICFSLFLVSVTNFNASFFPHSGSPMK